MLPDSEGDKTVLVCSSCGRVIKKFKIGEYRITEDVKHKEGDIMVVEEERKKPSEKDRKYIADLYGTEASESEE